MIDLFLFYFPKTATERTRIDFALLDLMIASARKISTVGDIHLYTHESALIPADLPITRLARIAPPRHITK